VGGAGFERPFRVIKVVKTDRGYAVVGETQDADQATPVTWNIMQFAIGGGRTEQEAEQEANTAALHFGQRRPEWFKGRAYVVDSSGRVREIK
jgi:hypothetical protein